MALEVGGSSPLAHPFIEKLRALCECEVRSGVRVKRVQHPSPVVKGLSRAADSLRAWQAKEKGRARGEELRAAANKEVSALRALVAQLAEQGTLNPKVEGSIPSERITRPD